MKSTVKLDQDIILTIVNQIKLQKKFLILSPFICFILLLLGILRNNGIIPPFYVNLIALFPLIIGGIYFPIVKGVLLGNAFYSVDFLKSDEVQFTTFSTLWRKEKKVVANQNNIKINKTPLPKLLYKKYLLNEIFIGGKKYFILNKLLEESGL